MDNSRFGKWFIDLMRLCIVIGVCFMDALNITLTVANLNTDIKMLLIHGSH